jgi:hypothetical protein
MPALATMDSAVLTSLCCLLARIWLSGCICVWTNLFCCLQFGDVQRHVSASFQGSDGLLIHLAAVKALANGLLVSTHVEFLDLEHLCYLLLAVYTAGAKFSMC